MMVAILSCLLTVVLIQRIPQVVGEGELLVSSKQESYPTQDSRRRSRQTSTIDEIFQEVDNEIRPDVLGGTLVNRGDYPSFAFSNGIFSCGATLIWNDVLVTAASCDFGPLSVVQEAISFYIGGTQGDGSDAVETARIKRLVPHPNYTDAARDNIMLILLQTPISNKTVTMAKWNTNVSAPSVNAVTTVLGLGCAPKVDRPLFEVDVTISNFTICDDALPSRKLVPNQTICTAANDETGPCLRSHGGAMIDTKTKALLGVVSIATAGRRPSLPNVYTRVSAYTDWMRDVICQYSAVPPPLTIISNGNNSTNSTNGANSTKPSNSTKPTNSSTNGNNGSFTCSAHGSTPPAPTPPVKPPIKEDCMPPPDNCKLWNTFAGTRLRRSLLGSCSEICSPFPWISMALGWRCGECD